MKYKNYKDEIKESGFGVITEGVNAGKHSYVENPEIKEIEIDGKFVANEGYNFGLVKTNEIKNTEYKIMQKNMEIAHAQGLTILPDLQSKLDDLLQYKQEIELIKK